MTSVPPGRLVELIAVKEGKVLRSERYLGTMTRAFTLPKHKGAPSHRHAIR